MDWKERVDPKLLKQFCPIVIRLIDIALENGFIKPSKTENEKT